MEKKLLIRILASVVLISTVSFFSLNGQNRQTEADYFFMNQRYEEALPLYLGLLTPGSSDPSLNFKIGKCYLESRSQKEKAVPFLRKASVFSSSPVEGPGKSNDILTMAYKYLGDACFLSHRFDSALSSYEIFKKNYPCPAAFGFSTDPGTRDICDEVNRKMEMSLLGKKITESLACLPADESKDEFFENIILSRETIAGAETVSSRNPPDMQFEATVAASTDGQVILIYKNAGGKAELFTIGLSENQWTAEERLSRAVNLSGWETGEYLSADGRVMYFASAQEGGYGGKDIYKCEKLPDGKWSKAMNLGKVINSPYNEEAPFIYTDETTLFFSSDRNDTGGFEVFVSRLSEDGSRTEPESVGFPVTPEEKGAGEAVKNGEITAAVQLTVQKEVKRSGKARKEDVVMKSVPLRTLQNPGRTPGSPGDDQAGNNGSPRNYLVSFYDQNKTPLVLLKGQVRDIYNNSVLQTKISVFENETGKNTGVFIADSSGKYSIIMPRGKNLNITFESDGYLFHSENMDLSADSNFYEIHNAIQLVPLAPGSEIALNNIFFIPGKTDISFFSLAELSNILNLLKKNPGITAEISYLAGQDKKNDGINAALAQGRAQAVADYLSGNGIPADRITARGIEKLPKGKASGCELRVSGFYLLSRHPE